MKNIYKVFITVILLSSYIFPQAGWEWIDTGFPFILYDISFPSGQNSVGYAVGSNSTYNGDGIILKTTDGGTTWQQISSGTIPGLEAVCFTSVDVGYAGGWQNYFIKTTDGGATWNQITIDPNIWYFKDIEFWDANNGALVTADPQVYITTDAGNTWTAASGVTQGIEDLCYADANTLFAVGGDEKISKSTDGGINWTNIYSGVFTYLFFGVDFLNANFGVVGGEDGKVMITSDGGATWTETNASGFALWHGVKVLSETFIYLAGTPEQVYKSTDGGNTWVNDFNGSYNEAFYKIKFTDNSTAFICGSGGTIMRNSDYTVPVELTSFTANVNGNDVVLNWSTATELNNSGFEIERQKSESNWEKIGFVPGFGTTTEQHSYSFTDSELGEGIYSYRLKQVDYDGTYEYSDEVNVDISAPVEFNLAQNYPNPFNPSTFISFTIPNETQVKLSVYNSLGEEVAVLVNNVQSAGTHTVEFSANNFASGTYFYKLESGSFVSVKKMILMK